MALSLVPAHVTDLGGPETGNRSPLREWAVVEIRGDGSLGHAEVVRAAEAPHPEALSTTDGSGADIRELSADLAARLGLLQAAGGHLHQAHRTLVKALSLTTESPQLENCLGPLALIEAFQGNLGRACTRADEALGTSTTDSVGTAHAHLAKAWIHLERTELDECERCLERVENTPAHDSGPWLETARVLAAARLLIATSRPDAAVGLLAGGVDTAEIAPASGWISGVMDAVRAEALLAAGEPRRALAAVTPLPDPAIVEASVAAAAARRDIGDARGASAVLRAVTGPLESSPLALQIRAWILESHLADDAGDHERSWLLIDRALRSAAAEQLRTPLRDDWRWLRAYLDREPHLMHRYRAFIVSLERSGAPRSPRSGGQLGAALTARECEVLELLAQMYSTEEIARTLYVSSNTIKTHVKGIFGKLCVNRRADAVRSGRALGLC